MPEDPLKKQGLSAAELKRLVALRAAGARFLAWRDGGDELQLLALNADVGRLTIGRTSSAAIALTWDAGVSKVHAELVPRLERWYIEDEGLSKNGTMVGGRRIGEPRCLAGGDEIVVGGTMLIFEDAQQPATSLGTQTSEGAVARGDPSEQELNAVATLSEPVAGGSSDTPASSDTLTPGAEVDGFEIGEVVADGAMTTTYRAHQTEHDRTVLITMLRADAVLERGERERAREEAVRAGGLEHPAIVPVLAAGALGERLYVVTAEIDGLTLADAVERGDIPLGQVGHLLAPVADALDAAHRHGVIHGEVRPECIVMDRYGNARLRDFGVTYMSGRTGLATRAEFPEILRYVAPERLLTARITSAADIFGLAGTAVWCMTARHPFPDLPVATLLGLRAEAPPPGLQAEGVDISGVARAIAEGMALDAGDRPATAGELIARIDAALGALPEALRARSAPVRLADPGQVPAPAQATPEAIADPLLSTRVDRLREYVAPTPEKQPGRSWSTIAAGVGIALATGIAAFAIGGALAPDQPPPPRTGGFVLALGDALSTSPAEPALAAGLEQPVGVLDGRGAAAAIGTVKTGPLGDPVPAAALTGFRTEPVPDLISAGKRRLVRYASGRGPVLLALPTSGATLVARCAPEFAARSCAALLAGASLGKSKPVAPQPPEAAAQAVARVGEGVETARGNAVGLAGKRLESAEAANSLAGDYRSLAPELDVDGVDPGTATQLSEIRESLEDAAAAYEDLAQAVDRGRAVNYAAARTRALQADAGITRQIEALRRSGYDVG